MENEIPVTVLKIGVAQTPNSPTLEKNFSSIEGLLSRFERTDADVVLFPECGLSGFSTKMPECSQTALSPYLDRIQAWTDRTEIQVILPTAVAEGDRVYNSGFLFRPKVPKQAFYKTGLTESERTFFATPSEAFPKVFDVKGFRLGLLICFEAELHPWRILKKDDADAILWPGYWGWELGEDWCRFKKSGVANPVFLNMEAWRMPLIQANFSNNDPGDCRRAGPAGLSVVVQHCNTLLHRGPHLKSDGHIVSLRKTGGKTVVSDCLSL